ncbi:DUF5056 domain-containing protein [Prevotella cerevisiae]|uniref:DUF5056 domain-containing protein n=1 Tax=Segatella cerevisiae TaxID=2053716 RepID=A0ABT1BY97_9BACT|nr:DUF5056 domain-containing protein [Segatella cerevisiae]MCO6026051.1 DUF5056 domain-containing protein [Segatella cerevisiae]
MIERDEQLVNRFFAEHSEPIPDKGFSEKVMRNIPDRAWYISRIWGVLCVIAGILLFVEMKGWELLGTLFQSSFIGAYHSCAEKVSHIKITDILSHFDISGHTILMFMAGAVTVMLVLIYNVIMDEKEK